MKAVAGVFASSDAAVRALRELPAIVPEHRLNYLSPSGSSDKVEGVATTKDMAPVGGVIGGALGGAAGLGLGAAASLLIPGVGIITSAGLAAMALFGAGGAVAGGLAGKAADNAGSEGLPVDELYVYKDALEKGKTVIIAVVENDAERHRVSERMKASGAESIDAARESWVVGMRDADKVTYPPPDVAKPEKRAAAVASR